MNRGLRKSSSSSSIDSAKSLSKQIDRKVSHWKKDELKKWASLDDGSILERNSEIHQIALASSCSSLSLKSLIPIASSIHFNSRSQWSLANPIIYIFTQSIIDGFQGISKSSSWCSAARTFNLFSIGNCQFPTCRNVALRPSQAFWKCVQPRKILQIQTGSSSEKTEGQCKTLEYRGKLENLRSQRLESLLYVNGDPRPIISLKDLWTF